LNCRRYFFKALASDPDRAKTALAYLAALFKSERAIANETRNKKEAMRDKKLRPIFRDFFAWCRAEQDLVLDDSPMDVAIGCALNQQQALERYLEDGRSPMTNNISERNLRKEEVGRKNWLFVGSEDGATAGHYLRLPDSQLRTPWHEPWRYLRDLFYLLPDWPKSRILALAYFEQTLQQVEAKRRLDEKNSVALSWPSR
jgi:transposase